MSAYAHTSDEVVATVRKRAADGETVKTLAAEYRVYRSTIRNWLRGATRGANKKKYKHLSNDEVCRFRNLASKGRSLKTLCREYGVSLAAGHKLVSGERRTDAGGPFRHQWKLDGHRIYVRGDGWSADEDEMAMTLPAKVVSERTGRTERAVWARKRRIRDMEAG